MTEALITADFASYEDFSSRTVLLPRHDDVCTGAKVASHQVVPDAPIEEEEEEEEGGGDDPAGNPDGDPGGDPAGDPSCDDAEVAVVGGRGNKVPPSNGEVPVGYVLVKINQHGGDGSEGTSDDVKDADFADLLSRLRVASFPLSLVFAPPHDTHDPSHCRDGSSDDTSDTNSSSGPLDVEEELTDDGNPATTEGRDEAAQQTLAAISAEEAAKYAKEAAKQAATELRGRLSRWGHVAATRAADAASQARAVRDERQRKVLQEEQRREEQREEHDEAAGGLEDPSDAAAAAVAAAEEAQQSTSTEGGKSEHPSGGVPTTGSCRERVSQSSPQLPDGMDPCHLFVQTSSGFVPMRNNDPKAFPPITNHSVVAVRHSEAEACRVGKQGGYAFQWHRSKMSDEVDGPSGWSMLRGACYAAYQPSVTDVGHRLRCIVKYGAGEIACDLPCVVRVDETLFDSVTKSLLGGNKSMTFINLREVGDGTSCSLRVDVQSDDDFITGRSICIERAADDTDGASERVQRTTSHYSAFADPAKPRLFHLITASEGRLRLEAANRKSRESLLLALGLANFQGKLSSLTPETALFQGSDESETQLDRGVEPIINDSVDNTAIPDEASPDSKLEERLADMHRLLESKDVAINKLQQELVASESTNHSVEKEVASYREALARCERALEEKMRTVEEMEQAGHDAAIKQERTVKALHNEKAVLSSTIEARDRKVEVLTQKVAELESETSRQSEQLSSVESLKSDLLRSQEKLTSAERLVAKMKETESELQEDLENAKGIVIDLNDKFIAAKETASKCESQCRKLKIERVGLKNRADGLSKEMLRMNSKENSDSSEVEKLKEVLEVLRQENADLQRQIETSEAEKRAALRKLEATCLAHQQSVSYQLSSERNGESCVLEQRIDELERVIASMTEVFTAKEMQIETLKQVNGELMREINELNRSE